jgi:hypothetical protein
MPTTCRSLLVLAVTLASCDHASAARSISDAPVAPPPPPAPSVSASAALERPSAPTTLAHGAETPPQYPWLTDPPPGTPPPVDDLARRFPAPEGFARVALPERSFGAFLRGLPLAAAGTPVRAYDGHVVLPADDERIAGVVSLDVGTSDLQQCADSVLRLHAEWQWSEGRRDISYRAASGLSMDLASWLRGNRPIASGSSLAWVQRAASAPEDHQHFRKYLDDVFAWANTGSLSREGKQIDVDALSPGDFVVKPGAPGHAVLVLDLAVAADGRRRALLGQGFMPAQSFQVLKDPTGSPWFSIDVSAPLDTPFWSPFPWTLLRRMPART